MVEEKKRNRVMYNQERINGHLVYRIVCNKCGKYDPKYKEWLDDPRTIIKEPVEWCTCGGVPDGLD
jgi:hypothetical protein